MVAVGPGCACACLLLLGCPVYHWHGFVCGLVLVLVLVLAGGVWSLLPSSPCSFLVLVAAAGSCGSVVVLSFAVASCL